MASIVLLTSPRERTAGAETPVTRFASGKHRDLQQEVLFAALDGGRDHENQVDPEAVEVEDREG